ncbi:hypothetical protein MPRS_17930 [Mycobacterium paraseoulense]|nr:hypothetical protein MPRS_17930 [Mycobacterium paraseoulense]
MPERSCVVAQGISVTQYFRGAFAKRRACGGEAHVVVAADEQGHPELAFQRPHRSADRCRTQM